MLLISRLTLITQPYKNHKPPSSFPSISSSGEAIGGDVIVLDGFRCITYLGFLSPGNKPRPRIARTRGGIPSLSDRTLLNTPHTQDNAVSSPSNDTLYTRSMEFPMKFRCGVGGHEVSLLFGYSPETRSRSHLVLHGQHMSGRRRRCKQRTHANAEK